MKASDEKFPEAAIGTAGYGAIWRAKKLERYRDLGAGRPPVETRRGLPGDPDNTHSGYIEAAIDGKIVECLYMPNGIEKAGATPPPFLRDGQCHKPFRFSS